MAAVRAVASFTDTPVLELDPLYVLTDPAHLEGLFEETPDETLHESNSGTFPFNGCRNHRGSCPPDKLDSNEREKFTVLHSRTLWSVSILPRQDPSGH